MRRFFLSLALFLLAVPAWGATETITSPRVRALCSTTAPQSANPVPCYDQTSNTWMRWNGTTWESLGGTLPSYTLATLPTCTAALAGRLYNVTNSRKGIYVCNGTSNVPFLGVMQTNWFPGTDLGTAIQEAHNANTVSACPTAIGCSIETGDFQTTQTVSALAFTKPVHLHLGCGAFNISGITVTDAIVTILGSGGCTKLTWAGSATGYGIQCLGCGPGSVIKDLKIIASAATPMAAGVRIGNTLTTYSSQVLIDNVTVECTNGGCTNPFQFDPYVLTAQTTNSVSGSLNNVTSPITIAVASCSGFTPAGTLNVLIDDTGNYELAQLAVGGCSGTNMTLTRPNALTHAGTQTLIMTADANNDLHTIKQSGGYNYTGAAFSIEGTQSMHHKLDHFFWGGGLRAGTSGIRTGTAKIGGGSFSIDGGGYGATDIDIYLYNTIGDFSIRNLTLENSVRFIETANALVQMPTVVQGVRWASGRLNADHRYILWQTGGPLTLMGNTFWDTNAGINNIIACAPSSPTGCMAYGNWITSNLANPFANGPWDQSGNVQADNTAAYVARIPPTSYTFAVGTSGTVVTKHLSATGTVGNGGGNIAANACITDTITVTGAATGDTVVLGPPSDIEASLTWAGAVTSASTVTVRLCNPTAGALASADKTWRADTWTH